MVSRCILGLDIGLFDRVTSIANRLNRRFESPASKYEMRSDKSSLHDRLCGQPCHHFLGKSFKAERKAAGPAPPEEKERMGYEVKQKRLGNSKAPFKDLFRLFF